MRFRTKSKIVRLLFGVCAYASVLVLEPLGIGVSFHARRFNHLGEILGKMIAMGLCNST